MSLQLDFGILIIIKIICVYFILLINCDNNSVLNREKRTLLTFPRTSPTRIQIITGIGVPLDLRFESVTFGWVLKAEYFLPENASNYLDGIAEPFEPTIRPINQNYFMRSFNGDASGNKKNTDSGEIDQKTIGNTNITNTDEINIKNKTKRNVEYGYDQLLQQKYEKYKIEAVEIESGPNYPPINDGISDPLQYTDDEIEESRFLHDDRRPKEPQSFSSSRWSLYKILELLITTKGFEGRSCLLRSICESAHVPFTYKNGLFGELLHVIMTPSTSPDKILDHTDNEYLKAEVLGQSGAPCDKIFKECESSLLEQFSGIYHSLEHFLEKFG